MIRPMLNENCYWCDEPMEQDTPATVHYGLATMAAHLGCCERVIARNDGTLRVSNVLTGDYTIPRNVYQ